MKKHIVVLGLLLVAVMTTNLFAAETTIGNVASKFDINIYGYVKLDAIYDSQETVAGDLAFYVKQEGPDGSDSQFYMTAKETRLGLAIAGPEAMGGKVSGKIETDFYGKGGTDNAANLRMRLAYLDWAFSSTSIRAGQDWEAFITAIPKSVNFAYMADQGALGLRRPQVRVTQNLNIADGTKVILKAAAVRTIGQDIDGAGQNDGADSGVPSVQYNLMLQQKVAASKPLKVGVSGHFGKETLDTNGEDDNEDFDTWSVIGSLVFPITDMVTVQGTIWTGENLDTYYGGIGQGINKKRDDTYNGIKASGGWAQVVLNPMAKLNINLTYGLDKPDEDDLTAIGDYHPRSQNQYIGGSAYYSFIPELTLAVEYVNLTTEYKTETDTDDVTDNRIQAAAIYKF